MFLGATAFGAIARTAWALAPAPTDDDPNRRVLGVVKNNLAMRPANLALTRDEDGPIRWLGTTTDDIELLLQGGNQREAKTPERSDILDVLEEHPEGMTPQQVADAATDEEGLVGLQRRPFTGVDAFHDGLFLDGALAPGSSGFH